MFIKRFYEPLIAQASYLIGCQAAREAIVIDANRDVDQYIQAAAQEGLRIAHVTETHIHADYVSGSRELARRAGAALYLSDEGDADWKYGFIREGRPIRHGDRISVGNVRIDVVHTPGHTPEHLTFLVTDGAAADRPIAAVTGDFIFVGDVGRPDLLERAANLKGTMEHGARTLWRSLQAFSSHDDWLQIWPGHGAGSACGKGISAIPSSTLGYEKRFNWAFRVATEDAFVSAVLAGQPEPPKYFATMKRVNKEGPPLLGGFRAPRQMDDHLLLEVLRQRTLVIDTRPAGEYAVEHLPGTINIPLNASFVTWAGWFAPYDQDFYVIVDEAAAVRVGEVARALALIGLECVTGYFVASAIGHAASRGAVLEGVPQMTPRDLVGRLRQRGATLVDVRSAAEFASGHIADARHIALGYLPDRVADIPEGKPVVVQCESGARSAIGASVLRRLGRRDVYNLVGGFAAWAGEGLPVVRDAAHEGQSTHA